jgi:hypothetical protein
MVGPLVLALGLYGDTVSGKKIIKECFMKNLLVILVAGLVYVSCATSPTEQNSSGADAPPYISVIDAPGISQDVLYRRLNSWFVDTFKSAESVIQYQDKDEGIIKGKYSFDIMRGLEKTPMLGTITVEVKEGRYRAQFSDPQFANAEYEIRNNPFLASLYDEDSLKAVYGKIKESWDALLSQLASAMVTATEEW